MSWEELVVAQDLALGRDLVTYWATSWLVSSSPDGPLATGAPAPHCRGRGNDRGSPACLTSGADWQLCGRRDTPVWCKTSDATDCADWDQTTLCSADTLVDRTLPPGMLNSCEPAGKLENKSRAGTTTKRGRNKRRKLFSESLRRKRTLNKAKEFYTAGIRPKVQRGLQPARPEPGRKAQVGDFKVAFGIGMFIIANAKRTRHLEE